ncbi:transmembrane protein, putative (macronuclear) [Tetrahymena thermophila SB210]|uniref:Transmembrane protein, putative n=1 Tax=Tetrahymena thermophila (strain SB210) TaxID=312017 RepID=W7XJU9_TETTS|nr:transmembrane protein, putative [Tetrahymena thermophila SB210]EWS75966.1 transmembrane protein, putative [Tetrahymena thermophila SB210]|eukprot:XP_012651484.1 transmembrane protein, putative [Tetrahymena thermophila SB210]
MLKIKQYIKEVDQFSNSIGLHMNNSFYYKTTFGGLITIFAYTFILLFFQSSISSFFEKEQVKVVTDSKYNPNPPISFLNPSRFMFAVQIYQKNFLTNPYFNITVIQKTQINEPSSSTKKIQQYEIQLEPCTLSHWELIDSYANFTELFLPYGLDYLCPTMDSVIFIEGMYGSKVFSYFEILVTPCVTPNDPKRKWNPICAPQEEVDAATTDKGNQGISFYHSNYVLNVDQSQKFFTPFINDRLFFTFVPHKMARNCDIYLQDISVVNDESIFFNHDFSLFKFPIQQNNDYREITELGRKDDTYVVLTIRLNPQVTQINRSYQKFTELLSKLGGLAHLVMASLAVVIKKYNLFQFTIELANKLYQSDYNFKIKSSKGKKNNKNSKKKYLQQDKQNCNENESNQNSQMNIQSFVIKDINNFSQLIQPQPVENQQNNQSYHTCLFKNTLQLESLNHVQINNISSKNKNGSQKLLINLNKNLDQNSANKQKIDIPSIQQEGGKKHKKCIQFFKCKKKQAKTKSDQQDHNSNEQISVFKYLIYYLLPRFKMFYREGTYVTQAIQLVNSDLDVLNIIKKTQQIDKLKNIIFDKHQKRLFDFAYRQKSQSIDEQIYPQAEINQFKPQSQQIFQNSNEFITKQDQLSQILYDSYSQVKNQLTKNHPFQNVNQRLIDHIDKEVLKEFQFKDACYTLNQTQSSSSQQPSHFPTQTVLQLNLTSQNGLQKKSNSDKRNYSFSQINLNANTSQNSQQKSNQIKKSIKSVSALTNNLEYKSQEFKQEKDFNKKQIPEENTEACQILIKLEKYQKDQKILKIQSK